MSKELKIRALELIKKYSVTAYEIEKNTHLSAVGVQKIIDGDTQNPQKPTLEAIISYITNSYELKNSYTKQNQIKSSNDKGVPYFDGEVTSTITTSFMDIPAAPTFYINIPPLNDCDAYITNRGDSMFPKYRNGEILGIKRIYNLDVIQWGESHLVITNANANDMRTVKNVHSHPDNEKIILRASNPNNSGDTIINKEDILEIYIIKANLDITHL